MTIITLCSDPNDGTHGLFVDGKRVVDSGDYDATPEDLFWPEALAAVAEALGGTLVEENRYRPSRRDDSAAMEGFSEYESYWPDTLDKMGPVEPPYEEPEGELTAEDLDPNAEWNTAGYS
jgi:hypothetical protein